MNIGSVLIVGIAIVAVAAALYGWVILTVDAYRDRRDRDNEELPRIHDGRRLR